MEVILLERVAKLGQMGETVRVRDGYARNFLLARGKALRATEENKKRFETQRAQLEARNLELKREADSVAESLDGQSVVILRQSGESGVLYGSVSTRDIAEALGAELVPMGSAGAKAMAVILGQADIYLHAGGQYEWDSCAPAAVALAHGLHASRIDGSPLIYNQEDTYMPDLLICRHEHADAVLGALAEIAAQAA